MSDLRIGLVAEGPTDYEILHAALRAILSRPFVMTRLQPEATRPEMGTGWCGVLKWCHASRLRHPGPLEADPTLTDFDLIVLHLDADVAGKQYADCGSVVETMSQEWSRETLPCTEPCPPAAATCARLEVALDGWLGQLGPGDRTVYCIPAQASDAWLAAVAVPAAHALLSGDLECAIGLETALKQLPKPQRIKKTVHDYRRHAPRLTDQWSLVKQRCAQAAAFERLVLSAVNP